jgi:hypothetical protein
MAIKYTDIFHCKILPNLPNPPKFGFFVWKYTIWQPRIRVYTHSRQIMKTMLENVMQLSDIGSKFDELRPGLPDGLFSDQKNRNLGKCWRVLQWKMLVYFLWKFGLFCGNLVPFPSFGILYQENYGNPGSVLSVTSKFGQNSSFYERLVSASLACGRRFKSRAVPLIWGGPLNMRSFSLVFKNNPSQISKKN